MLGSLVSTVDNECSSSSFNGLGQKLLRLGGSPLPVSYRTNNKLKSPRYLRPGRVDFHLQAALFAFLQHNLLVAKRRNASVDGIGRSFGNSSQPRAEYKDRLAAGATHKTGSVNLPCFDCVTVSPPCWPLRHGDQILPTTSCWFYRAFHLLLSMSFSPSSSVRHC